MAVAPSGTVTFLFTDIEDSTRLWDQWPDEMRTALAKHDEVIRQAAEHEHGLVFKTIGDAFCVAFSKAESAVSAAIEVQRSLSNDWAPLASLRVRMAIHTGAPELREGDYFGPPLNLVARLLNAAHGEQILVSQASADLLKESAGPFSFLPLGEHTLRGIEAKQAVYQVLAEGLREGFPPLRLQDAGTVRLPSFLSSFVGRTRELAQLRTTLLEDSVRLVTLTGPGGAGKTRLAVQLASEVGEHFQDGVFFVALSGVTDAGLVPNVLARALGVRDSAGRSSSDAVASYLEGQAPLLVVDNFEQVAGAAAFLSGLARSTKATFIVTSRSRLGVYGERAFDVDPLELPSDEPTTTTTIIRESESVNLFVDRARAVEPGFELTEANATVIAEICRRLDGLPLAIELAAARIRHLGPTALLSRLGQRLRILTGGPLDLERRQQTLRATISWSHDLLDEQEKLLFRRLAPFRGCTLEAIEHVCNSDGALRVDALEGVASLCDKSLLKPSHASPDRFTMLETIREFAVERLLEGGDEQAIRGAHAAFYSDLAATLNPQLRSSGQVESFHRLELEHDNLRAALDWYAAASESANLARLACDLSTFWLLHGDLAEGYALLRRAIDQLRDAPDSARATCKLLIGAGWLIQDQGDDRAARDLLERAIHLASTIGDDQLEGRARTCLALIIWKLAGPEEAERLCEASIAQLTGAADEWGQAEALHYLGHMALDRGDLSEAEKTWDRSIALFRGLGDRWSLAQPLKDLGLVSARRGEYAAAHLLYEESLAILRETREKSHVADVLNRMGELALFEHDYKAAGALFSDALTQNRELGNRPGVIEAMNHMAELKLLENNAEAALALYLDCLALAKEASNPRLIAGMLHNLALVNLQQGNVERSVATFQESLPIFASLGRDLGVASSLEGLAEASLASTDLAARLLGLATAARERARTDSDPFDRIEHHVARSSRAGELVSLRDTPQFAAYLERGRDISLHDIVELALRGDTTGSPAAGT